jgi:hypothetical protein
VDGNGEALWPEWLNRMWPCVVNGSGGTLWLFGGYRQQGDMAINLSDLWYSKDGLHWRQLKPAAPDLLSDPVSRPRHAPSCHLDAANRLTVVAGRGDSDPDARHAAVLNDVIRIDLPRDSILP